MSGLLNKIKEDVSRSGSSKASFFYVREGEKKRVRFLQELDDGYALDFYKTKWGAEEFQFFASPENFGEDDPYAESEDYVKQVQYCWSVWDYDSEEVKVFMYASNRCSPIPPLIALNDTYGSVTDRDFVVSTTGKRVDKTYQIVPMDKAAFRNKKAKPLSESALKDKVKEGYPWPSITDSDDDSDWDDDAAESTDKYDSMSAKELYKLCKERDINAEPRKDAKYYAKKLRDADAADDDWDDGDDDDWEDED